MGPLGVRVTCTSLYALVVLQVVVAIKLLEDSVALSPQAGTVLRLEVRVGAASTQRP